MERNPQTHIICTIGPSSNTLEVIEEMFLKGMTVVRINASHGSLKDHQEVIKNVRKVEEKYNQKIVIALDTKGPENRIICKEQLVLKKDDIIDIYTLDSKQASKNLKYCKASNIDSFDSIQVGDKVIVDDSKLILTVISIEFKKIAAKALNSHILKPGKRICFTNNKNGRIFLSEEDKIDIKFALENKLDALFLSFVETVKDIIQVRELIKESRILIFPKIESRAAIENLNQIVEYSDGIMIARGDLMNDIGIDNLFSAQKYLSSYSKHLPVIMATEILQSMITSATPNRSEISDIGNAVLDGCGAVMLSGESAVGKNPALCVDVLRRVCIDSEKYMKEKNNFKRIHMFEFKDN